MLLLGYFRAASVVGLRNRPIETRARLLAMAPSHNRCIVRPSVAEFDETVRQIFEIFGEAMETSGPQLTKNLEVRRCLEKMLEQNEAGFRADMKQTDDWNECRLARIRAAVLTRRLMTQQLSLVEREAREKAEQRLQAVEEDLHFASDLCQLHQRWRDSVMEVRQGHGFQEKEATPVLEADGASEAPEEEQFAGCPAAPAVLLGKTRRVTQDMGGK
ncbi:Eukaryotic translation initiation factor 4E type 1B [Durusdinium trenchii]|uniref:Eukaryotic translation initiation factor 4E type 1B n=1 Tax=Durusdinium trenchii TaxID=1381693 RepID=A0ABP0PBA8_9DINO